MRCCGGEKTSAYCPECGTPLETTPAVAMIEYISGKLAQTEALIKRFADWDKCRSEAELANRRTIEKRERQRRIAARYKTWIKWLEQHR